MNFTPTAGDRPLAWDKFDYDTWRVQPGSARAITVRYDYLADTLDNAKSWSRPDFVLFNGTNLLPYPEGSDFNFPATVTVKTQPGWLVATGMKRGPAPGSYQEGNYHDLVDKPFFVGRMDVDSVQVENRWHRLATYPAGTFTGPARSLLWDQIGKMIPPSPRCSRRRRGTPTPTCMIFTPEVGGGSALEHSNSHVGIYNPGFIGNPLLASITAHEVFHSWNVKRLRPAEMWPYHYDREQETPWLWVSEGITDYYADLALVRGGIVDSAQFMGLTNGKVDEVAEAPPTALEDASLSTWIGPTDGTQYLYYPKGSLVGLLLDIIDPRRQRQPPLAGRRAPRGISIHLQEGPRLHLAGLVVRGEPRRGRSLVHRVQRQVHRWARAAPLRPDLSARRDAAQDRHAAGAEAGGGHQHRTPPARSS